jgi:hypothetical protein
LPRVSTSHCSTIARLAFGAFYLAIPFDVFCESIFDAGKSELTRCLYSTIAWAVKEPTVGFLSEKSLGNPSDMQYSQLFSNLHQQLWL